MYTVNNSHQPNISVNVSLTIATRGTALIVIESCIFVLLNIAALVGNLLVCIALYRRPSLRTVTNYFVLSLALTDLSMAVFVMPFSVISSIASKWVVGSFACKMSGSLTVSLGGASIITVALVAVNRYFCIVRPALYNHVFSKKRSLAMAVCAFIVPIAMGPVVLTILKARFGVYRVQPAVCRFYTSKLNHGIVLNGVLGAIIAINTLIIVVCYIRIYQTIHHHNTAAATASQGGHVHSAYGVEEAKMTRMLTVVVAGVFLCWLPILCGLILWFLVILKGMYMNLYYTFPLFASSVINPFIYGTMSQSFRNEFLKIILCRTQLPPPRKVRIKPG